jgi:hypothetical protein
MKIILGGALLGLFTLAQAQTAYVDVPSCHWAVQAISAVSSGDQPVPAQNATNAQNAVRHPAYSKKFIANAPIALDTQIKRKPLRSFVLTFGRTAVVGDSATVAVNLTLNLATGVERRSATVSLSSDPKAAWKVNYASLAALNLSMFPK